MANDASAANACRTSFDLRSSLPIPSVLPALDRQTEPARRFPPPVRRMGDGYEPHVDDWAGRLVYSLPVDCGFVSLSASYPIDGRDLAVLLADPYRRAVLEVVAHAVLQRSMIRGNPEVTEQDFRRVVDAILHSDADDLEAFIARIDRDHNASVHHFVEAAMRRRDAETRPCEGEATCGS